MLGDGSGVYGGLGDIAVRWGTVHIVACSELHVTLGVGSILQSLRKHNDLLQHHGCHISEVPGADTRQYKGGNCWCWRHGA